MVQKKIRVFHLEDYKIIREGVRFLLSQDPGIEVVGEAKDAEELLNKLTSLKVDVLLLDIHLEANDNSKSLTGFDVSELIHNKFPGIKIIAHTVYDGTDNVTKMIKAGAMGFVSKRTGYEELVDAIKAVYSGKRFICSESSKKFKNADDFLAGLSSTLKIEKQTFSKREMEVLKLLAKGYSTKQIAKLLYITEKTVESHRKNMSEKVNAKNTVELVSYALAKGIIVI